MDGPLTVLSDLSERLNYNLRDFPLYTKEDELKRYGYAALCHWHPDLEFIFIKKGTMDYFINGKTVRLEQGQAIFVNSRRLHYGFSKERKDCTFIALVIHPRIFSMNTEIGCDYQNRKFGWLNPDYIVLYPHVSWHNQVIEQILDIHLKIAQIVSRPLSVMSAAIRIVDMIGEHISDCPFEASDNHDHIVFLNMTAFVHDHYSEKISTDDIASSGLVSRTKSYQLFNRFVRMPPNKYLTNYRIAKSAELLRDTHLSISEISEICGFQTPSYFTSVFHQEKGLSPRDYRTTAKLT